MLRAVEDYRTLDGHPVLLQRPRIVHAFPGWLDTDTPKAEFRTSAAAGAAWCSARVKVILAEPFDAGAKDACPTCAQYIRAGVREPEQPLPPGSPFKPCEEVFVGHERYDEVVTLGRNGFMVNKHFKRTMPSELGLAHAVSVWSRYPKDTRFLDPETPARTWCGTHCLVITPFGFWSEDTDACPDCAKAFDANRPMPMKVSRIDPYEMDNTLKDRRTH